MMLDIFNPIHNLKEICKEFVLLEDHLQAPEKRCPDCIRKHLLKAEAFAEEAIALDKTNKHQEILKPLPIQIREIQEDFMNGANDHLLGQKVRMIRKKLSPICFSANLDIKSKAKKTEPKTNKNITLAKRIADGLWPERKHLKGYKCLILALTKAENSDGPAFHFESPGVSARMRSNPDWISKQAVKTLTRGQIGRMVSQSLHSDISYSPEEWIGAVRSDLLGDQRINLKTPSSSVGEIISDERKRKQAVQSAIEKGQKEILKRACILEQEGDLERSARMFMHIGKQTQDVYFFVKASTLYERLGDEKMESEAFKAILGIDPNHPLKFWLGNKIEIAQKIKRIPAKDSYSGAKEEKSEKKDNMVLLSLIAFGAGVGLGIV